MSGLAQLERAWLPGHSDTPDSAHAYALRHKTGEHDPSNLAAATVFVLAVPGLQAGQR